MLKMVRLRSPQGLTSMPPKPPVGNVIWNEWSNSGVDRNIPKIDSVYGSSCSTVALGGTSMAPKTTPWSSLGASSADENRYIGATSSVSTPQTV